MRELKIKGFAVNIMKGCRNFKVDGKDLDELIEEKLPKDMEDYINYVADIDITISIYSPEMVVTTNYEEKLDIEGGNESGRDSEDECV